MAIADFPEVQEYRNELASKLDFQPTLEQADAILYETIVKERKAGRTVEAQHPQAMQMESLDRSCSPSSFAGQPLENIFPNILNSGRYIRLLQLQVTAHAVRNVTCWLRTVALNEVTGFDALSYVWGNTDSLQTISVNGRSFSVTDNLYEALVMFRDTGVLTRWIWIDAICINQRDESERNHQVTLMKEVFTRATVVHIWMGLPVEGTEGLFDIIARATCSSNVCKWSDKRQSKAVPAIGTAGQCSLETARTGASRTTSVHRTILLQALQDLLRRPWWRRVWTLQEVALASDPIVRWGRHALSFVHLQQALTDLPMNASSFFIDWDDAVGPCNSWVTDETIQIVQLSSHFTNAATNVLRPFNNGCVADVLAFSSCRVATRQHDLVYGLLGILPADLDIVPDYAAPIEVVYEQATVALLQITKDPALLRFAGHRDHIAKGLPSWAVDFSSMSPRLQAFDSFTVDDHAMGGFRTVLQPQIGVLAIEATIIANVRICSNWIFDIHGSRGRYDTSERSLNHIRTSMRHWLKFACHAGSNVMSFWQCTLDRFTHAKQIHEVDTFVTWLEGGDGRLVLDNVYHDTLYDVIERVNNTRWFTTMDGGLGIAGGPVQVDDIIVAFAGSPNTFVVRAVDDKLSQDPGQTMYRLIGLCRWSRDDVEEPAPDNSEHGTSDVERTYEEILLV